MGLAISQVRLLALTSRKADLEQKMQIDSKRKQMLTRQSTELAQQYYNKLHNSRIQYATSAGYEDVSFDYLMGKTATSGKYEESFLQQIVNPSRKSNSGESYPEKIDSHMILTDQYGQVVTNNQVAEIVEKVNLSYPSTKVTTYDKTAYAILEFIQQNENNGLGFLYDMMADSVGNIVKERRDQLLKIVRNMVLNEGCVHGGDIYTKDNCKTFFRTLEACKNNNKSDLVHPQVGYMYTIHGGNSAYSEQWFQSGGKTYECAIYQGGNGTAGWFVDSLYSEDNIQSLAQLVEYFAPMFSAAVTNGTTAKVNV